MVVTYIGVGSNLDPERHVIAALEDLASRVHVSAASTFYRTRPLGGPVQPDYANGVLKAATDLLPRKLKGILRSVESAHGRVRSADRYAPRTIDLDILLFGEERISTPDLVIPSPDLASRPFLLLCLNELDPGLRIPGSPHTLSELLSTSDAAFEPYAGLTERVRDLVRRPGDRSRSVDC